MLQKSMCYFKFDSCSLIVTPSTSRENWQIKSSISRSLAKNCVNPKEFQNFEVDFFVMRYFARYSFWYLLIQRCFRISTNFQYILLLSLPGSFQNEKIFKMSTFPSSSKAIGKFKSKRRYLNRIEIIPTEEMG